MIKWPYLTCLHMVSLPWKSYFNYLPVTSNEAVSATSKESVFSTWTAVVSSTWSETDFSTSVPSAMQVNLRPLSGTERASRERDLPIPWSPTLTSCDSSSSPPSHQDNTKELSLEEQVRLTLVPGENGPSVSPSRGWPSWTLLVMSNVGDSGPSGWERKRAGKKSVKLLKYIFCWQKSAI